MTKFRLSYIGDERQESSFSWECFAARQPRPNNFLWVEFLSCVEEATITLPKGMQNLIPTENIQGVM